MSEGEGELDKFLYGNEYSNNLNNEKEIGENVAALDDEEIEEEEEEDDYEIILDSSKISSNAVNSASATDLNKRSLTSVAIGDGKGEEDSGNGTAGNNSSTPSTSAIAPVSHFDPFAPANLNGVQIFDHELDNFEDKPWRKPGADLTDYFNFGFNEVTWRAYCVKQKALREEFGLQKKIGVYDSSGAGVGMGAGSNTSLNNRPQRDFNRRPPQHHQGYGQQESARGHGQPQEPRGYNQSQDPRYAQQSQEPRGYTQPESMRGYAQPQPPQQDYRGHAHSHHPTSHYSEPRESREYPRSRSRHDSPSPPPPPPPSSRQILSRDRSRSRSRSPESATTQRRYVSRSSRYDDAPRSPPSKRRRD